MNSLHALPTFVYLLASLAPAGVLASDKVPWRGEAALSYQFGSRHDVYEVYYDGEEPLRGGTATASASRGEFGVTLDVSRDRYLYEDTFDRMLVGEWFDSVLVGPSWAKQDGRVRPFTRAMVGGTLNGSAHKSSRIKGDDFHSNSVKLRFSALIGAGFDAQLADRFFLRSGVDINRIFRPDTGTRKIGEGTTTHLRLRLGVGVRWGRRATNQS